MKLIFILITILLFAGLILVLFRIRGGFKISIKEAIEEAAEAGKLPKTKIQTEWENILSILTVGDDENYKKSVVLADELFNRILKMVDISGSNLKERLKKIPDSQLEFKEDIIWAHKLREKISTDENFIIDGREAKRAVYIFKRALKEMNII